MIVRLVQLTFRTDEVDNFIDLFEERKDTILRFEGCTHLELWQDLRHDNVFFTYSHWLDEKHLNHYRFSDFFKDTWNRTKALFDAPPQAWSVNRRSVAG